LRKAFYGDVKVVFTPKGGDEIDVRDFPVEDQLQVVSFMRKTMAPPQGLVRSDAELQALMQQLRFSSVTDAEFYKKLRSKLKMGKRQFSIVKNSHFQGEKTFDLNYFTDSLAARMYPQIIPECLRV
jgi:hypothetical protein